MASNIVVRSRGSRTMCCTMCPRNIGPATLHELRPASPETIHAPLRVPSSNAGPSPGVGLSTYEIIMIASNLLRGLHEVDGRAGPVRGLGQATVRRVLGGLHDRT